MMYWASSDPTVNEREELHQVLREEIDTSRVLEGLLGKGESKGKSKVWMLRRRLEVKKLVT